MRRDDGEFVFRSSSTIGSRLDRSDCRRIGGSNNPIGLARRSCSRNVSTSESKSAIGSNRGMSGELQLYRDGSSSVRVETGRGVRVSRIGRITEIQGWENRF